MICYDIDMIRYDNDMIWHKHVFDYICRKENHSTNNNLNSGVKSRYGTYNFVKI